MHQTEQDIQNELQVAEYLKGELTDRFEFVGHHLKWIHISQRGDKHDHDFEIWWHHLKVGIVEIKCREYSRDFFEREGYMIDRPKLEYLWKQNSRGFKAMLVVRTSDMFVYHAMVEDLVAGKDSWGTPSAEQMSTTNHGKEKRDKPFDGMILPMKLFKAGGWMK